MNPPKSLIEQYLPPEGFVLESLIATTYQIDFEFLEEHLLATALGVRSPVSRLKVFRRELERNLRKTEISVLYDPRGCEMLARVSPRIDIIPISSRKLHSKISLLMWSCETDGDDKPPEKRMRLLIGSANLTSSGFRENYECVAALDFGGKDSAPRFLLDKAIELIREIVGNLQSPQLTRQLGLFSKQSALLVPGKATSEMPVAVVSAEQVIPELARSWRTVSSQDPAAVTIASPFWPQGTAASDALAAIAKKLGSPPRLELICRGEGSADGKPRLPVFDGDVAVKLSRQIPGKLFLRAAKPAFGVEQGTALAEDAGDDSEDDSLGPAVGKPSTCERALHAKMIWMAGPAGSVLYVGSSNCTRRGLGGGGPTNFEAGVIYQFTAGQRRYLSSLFEFAGPKVEVPPGHRPATIQPSALSEMVVPSFLSEVVACGSVLTIRFSESVPDDLVLLMPVPNRADPDGTGHLEYWLLYQADGSQPLTFNADLTACPRCDHRLVNHSADTSSPPPEPNLFVEIRWATHKARFPVRFDDKTQLPLILGGHKPTEGELIDYFRSGREPDEGKEGTAASGSSPLPDAESPIDTRRILAYFIRRFTEAIPGMEAELRRASYSRAALNAALSGPTSPLALAQCAFDSLCRPPSDFELRKTPVAVGFQITEILASLLRCRTTGGKAELLDCFDAPIDRCRHLLETLISRNPELQSGSFRLYEKTILGRTA